MTETMPHNIEAEQALLGAILINNEALLNVAHILTTETFFEPVHARIYEAAFQRIMEQGGTANPVTLKSSFGRDTIDGGETGMSIAAYLGKLVANATTIVSAPDYATTIRELSDRRTVIDAANMFVADANDPKIPLGDVCSGMITDLDVVLESNKAGGRRISIGTAAEKAIDDLVSDEDVKATTTGLIDLDRATGGWFPGELVIMASRPGMGKSTLGPSSLLRAAMAGHGIGYQSLEMTNDQLAQRCLSDLVWNSSTPIPYLNIRRKNVPKNDIDRLKWAMEEMKSLPFAMDDTPALTVAEIAAKTRALQQRFERSGTELRVLAIDHMGLIRPDARYAGNKVAEVSEISKGLAALAKELGITVIAMSQLSRAVEGRDNKRPVLSDLRDSGSIEQDADVVLFLFRAAYYLENMSFDDDEKEQRRVESLEKKKFDLEIIIGKQRSGPTRTIRAFADMGSNAVRDMA